MCIYVHIFPYYYTFIYYIQKCEDIPLIFKFLRKGMGLEIESKT